MRGEAEALAGFGGKRDRKGDDTDREVDPATEAIIKDLLEEEQASKKIKKGQQDGADGRSAGKGANAKLLKPPQKKGKTLAEIEDEEGGPIK
jgi:hypothetical protein